MFNKNILLWFLIMFTITIKYSYRTYLGGNGGLTPVPESAFLGINRHSVDCNGYNEFEVSSGCFHAFSDKNNLY